MWRGASTMSRTISMAASPHRFVANDIQEEIFVPIFRTAAECDVDRMLAR
jgi:hypothetical protein